VKTFLKKVGRWVLDHLLEILAVTAGLVFAGWGIRKGLIWLSQLGKVDEPKNFAPVPGDPTRIMIRDDEARKWREVALPSGVTSDKVKAAGFAMGDPTVHVEVLHETVDRRDLSRYRDPIDGGD
jgi:hypothetical protein